MTQFMMLYVIHYSIFLKFVKKDDFYVLLFQFVFDKISVCIKDTAECKFDMFSSSMKYNMHMYNHHQWGGHSNYSREEE